MTRRFQRKKEDFVCSRCGQKVKGTGYTDHCPRCLWSRHCDINPGDRQAQCQGMMEPTGVEIKGGKHIIHYQCQKCGYKFRVKTDKKDNFDEMIKISKVKC